MSGLAILWLNDREMRVNTIFQHLDFNRFFPLSALRRQIPPTNHRSVPLIESDWRNGTEKRALQSRKPTKTGDKEEVWRRGTKEGKIDSLTAYHRSGSDVCETTIVCCSCEILIVDSSLTMGERVRVLLCRRPSGVNIVSTLSSRREAHDHSL